MNPGLFDMGARPADLLDTLAGGAHATGKHGGGGQHFTGQGFFCAQIILSSRRNGVPMIPNIEPKQSLASKDWPPPPMNPGPHIGGPHMGGGQGGGGQGAGAQACGGQGAGAHAGGAQLTGAHAWGPQGIGAHPWGIQAGGGAAHFFGPTLTGMGIGCPMGPRICCMLATASKDHAAMSSTANVRTGAIRFLVMKLSFNKYPGTGWRS